MTTLPRPRFWCLRYQTCGYSGESLAELVEHHWRQHEDAIRVIRRSLGIAKALQADVKRILS